MQKIFLHKIPLKSLDLPGLKLENDKLTVGKWETTPVDLSKLSDVAKNEFFRKLLFKTIDTSNINKSVKSWL